MNKAKLKPMNSHVKYEGNGTLLVPQNKLIKRIQCWSIKKPKGLHSGHVLSNYAFSKIIEKQIDMFPRTDGSWNGSTDINSINSSHVECCVL